MKNRTEKNGSRNDDWCTPKYILNYVRHKYGRFFDPCPLNPKFDGLKVSWGGVNFINPPYNIKSKTAFVKKAISGAAKGKTSILLIPAATETKVFMELWLNAHEIMFIHKRVKFRGYNTKGEFVTDKSGQSGSMLAVIKGKRTMSKSKPEVSVLFQEDMVVGHDQPGK